MGQLESRPSYHRQVKLEDGSFVIVTNDPVDTIQFSPVENYMVSYGIDYQISPKFKHKTLSPITATDAQLVRDSLVRAQAFLRHNTSVYTASIQTEECTFDGIKRTFQDSAAKVGPNGLLVFHFSGHGIKVGSNEWGLAPADFDYSRSTYLTAEILTNWISEVDCKAKHILFTLDCCYAGGIGRELTKSVNVQVDAHIYVISACARYETSLVIGPLKNSIFAYFLSYAILKCTSGNRALPIKEIFSLCQVCCESLSSLLIRYSDESGLRPGTMQPQMGVLNLQSAVKELIGEGKDQVDAAQLGRFQFVLDHYDRTKSIPNLSEKSYAYLDTISSFSDDAPLLQLEQKGVMNERVLNAIICSMMYSVASIELVCNQDSLLNPNLSITAFIHCVAAIDLIHSGVEFEESAFFVSLLFYREVLVENNVKISGLKPMLRRLSSSDMLKKLLPGQVIYSSKHNLTDGGPTDFPDCGAIPTSKSADEPLDLPSLHRWIPITESDY